MKRPGPWMIVPLLLSTFLVGAASGQASLKPSDLPEREQQFLQRSPEQFLNRLLQELHRHGPDRVATPATAARLAKIARGRQRAQYMSQFLSMDLDGNGVVTDDELRMVAGVAESDAAEQSLAGHQLARLRSSLGEVDTDRDGRATIAEISAHTDRRIDELAGQGRGPEPIDMMIFDLNGDARVDAAEVTEAVTRLAVAQGGAGAGDRPEDVACPAPPPPSDARLILLGTNGGGALATVATGSQEDDTSVVRVHLEPGETPLSVIATSRGDVIWKLSGATGRVHRFVVQAPPGRGQRTGDVAREAGPGSGAGVVGLAPDVVSFVPAMSCLMPFGSPDDIAAVVGAARLAAQFGRAVDHVMAHSGAGTISIPSGVVSVSAEGMHGRRVLIDGKQHIIIGDKPILIEEGTDHPRAPAKAGAASGLRRTSVRGYPEGVMEIDPADVVAPGPVIPYEVLPRAAGLAQLVEAGMIRRVKDGYLIAKPIPRFPPGLAGGHSVTFILPPGVPMPDGDPGDSSVVSQETGACLLGVRCRN